MTDTAQAIQTASVLVAPWWHYAGAFGLGALAQAGFTRGVSLKGAADEAGSVADIVEAVAPQTAANIELAKHAISAVESIHAAAQAQTNSKNAVTLDDPAKPLSPPTAP